jgi:hypothetical protein
LFLSIFLPLLRPGLNLLSLSLRHIDPKLRYYIFKRWMRSQRNFGKLDVDFPPMGAEIVCEGGEKGLDIVDLGLPEGLVSGEAPEAVVEQDDWSEIHGVGIAFLRL